MKSYCEKIARLLIPAIRSLVAIRLANKHKLSQTEVARIIGVTQPAVSYYIKAKRGNKLAEKLEGDPELNAFINDFAEKLYKGMSQEEVQKMICTVCTKVREKGYIN